MRCVPFFKLMLYCVFAERLFCVNKGRMETNEHRCLLYFLFVRLLFGDGSLLSAMAQDAPVERVWQKTTSNFRERFSFLLFRLHFIHHSTHTFPFITQSWQ